MNTTPTHQHSATRRIPVVFFTYDRDLETNLFTLQSYHDLWQHLNLEFFIPYSSQTALEAYQLNLPAGLAFTLVRVDPGVAATLVELIEAVLTSRDSLWFFWCTSDRIPIASATSRLAHLTSKLFDTQSSPKSDCIRLTRWRDIGPTADDGTTEIVSDICFNVSSVLPLFGFWHPQFVSRQFLCWLKDVAFSCKQTTSGNLHDFAKIVTREHALVTNLKVLLPTLTLAKFTESTAQGKWTLNYRVDRFRAGLHVGAVENSTLGWITFANPNQRKINNFWLQQEAMTQGANDQKESDSACNSLIQRKFPPLPTIVVTYGGSGSKFLLKNIYPNTEPSKLEDAHSHWRVPPITIEPSQKLVYIFGDPRNAILSFFARRHSLTHLHGFKVQPAEVQKQPRSLWVSHHLSNLETDAGTLTENLDLEQFLSDGIEQFRLEEHFDCWMYSRLPYPVYFCRYETLWENWGQLQRALGITRNDLPIKEMRRSNWTDLPESQNSALNKILGDFALRLEGLPDLFKVHNGTITDLNTGSVFVPQIV